MPTMTGLGAGVAVEEARSELTLLRGQVELAQQAISTATAPLEGTAIAELWSSRAVAWEGSAAERFRTRCLELELDASSELERARLVYAALEDARLTIEAELAGLG